MVGADLDLLLKRELEVGDANWCEYSYPCNASKLLTDIDRSDEDTAHEGQNEADLGSTLHAQFCDDGEGEHEDGNIREDVDRGGSEEKRHIVVALALEGGTPSRNGRATLLCVSATTFPAKP